ncbi:702f087e-da66-4b8c-944f-1a62dc44073c [Thermothielavioides terrestris]|uniref:702f087e-da66-4b8c-944f-1a62dc44073c n=1 Tax=Thermothielavioides terrestris TaxID=2587410 RepID=A0A446BLJ0_9PEZI|nr:702f087e-da66-4b8c-944f-1a62dc44073c [Thermothielavioides terrestris]
MKLNLALLPILAGLAAAKIGDLCKADGTSWCDSHGGSRPVVGACPHDPSDVMCCLYPTCDNDHGYCMDTADSANKCPGPSSYKCCVIS